MGKVIKQKIQGISWQMKASLVLLLTLTVTVVMYEGWYQPKQASAAITRVQSTTGATGTTAAATVAMTALGTAPVNGNTLVAVISTRGTLADRVTSITQTGATWSRVASSTGTLGTTTEVWYAPNVSGAGTGITVNLASAMFAAAVVAEYNGILTASAVDVSATSFAAVAGTAAVTGTTATTARADELWIGGVGLVNSTYTLGTLLNSFTSFANIASGSATAGNNARVYVLERIATATGAASSGGTVSTSSLWSGAIATFKMGLGTATITNCGGCHGYPGGTYTTFDGTRNNGLFPGSHNVHVTTYVYPCTDCHRNNTLENHGNGRINMATAINGIAGSRYKNLTSMAVINTAPAFGTCNSNNCHGQRSPVWGYVGNANSCLKCHGQLAGTFTNFSAANIAPGGTGQDTGGNTTGNRVGLHQNHLTASTISGPVRCNDCHSTVYSVTQASHMQYTTSRPVFKQGGNTTRVAGVIQCNNTECHTGLRTDGTAAGQKRAGGITLSTFNFTGNVLDGTTVSGTCVNKCHGLPPGGAVAGDSHSGLLASGSYTTPASLSVCSSNGGGGCHPNIAGTIPNFAGIFSNKAQHVDGVGQGGSCTGCHGLKGNRVDVAAQFNGANNSHHIQSLTAADGKACYACHWEADSAGNMVSAYHPGTSNSVVDLVVWNATTRPATNTPGVTSVTYQSGGSADSLRTEFVKINQHCLGCHNALNATTRPFAASGDASTPTKYAWDGLSVDARYSNTGNTLWGKFSGNDTNNKNTQTKQFSAHGRATANQRGWSTVADTYPSAVATSNVLCFDCHNSHGSTTSVAAVTSSYSSATGRRKGGILKDVVNAKGGYTTTYKPVAGGSAANKNVYNPGAALCFDCHNTATEGTIPWGYTSTFGFTPPAGQLTGTGIVGYYDTPYFGTAGANFIPTLSFAYKAGKSVNMGGHLSASSAMTTAITKRSFDPGTPSGTVIQGLCTPCHDPHGVSTSLGTNQQFAVPLLKGTWVTTPYKQDNAPVNTNEIRGGGSGQPQFSVGTTPLYYLDQRAFQAAGTGKPATARYWNFATSATTLQTTNDTQFAGLCTGCHAKSVLNTTAAASTTNWRTMTRVHNSVRGWASTGGGNAGNARHAFTCSKCHSVHNSRLPRLAITNCLDVKHRGRVASGGNMAASNTGSGRSGNGAGRFPGGGGGTNTQSRATNPGVWFFGSANSSTTNPLIVPACHASGTAGGATYSTGGQLWNTKTPW